MLNLEVRKKTGGAEMHRVIDAIDRVIVDRRVAGTAG